MSTNTAMLLQAASEVVGGPKALARRLGMGETLLARFMTGVIELPDALFLRAVDIVLEDRQSLPLAVQPASSQAQGPSRDA